MYVCVCSSPSSLLGFVKVVLFGDILRISEKKILFSYRITGFYLIL